MYCITVKDKKIMTEGGKLSDILRQNDIFIGMPCGGFGTCGKCTVYANGERVLACRTTVDRDMTVSVPEYSDGAIAMGGIRRKNQRYKEDGFGIAFDIGTTTVAGCLVDLSDGSYVRTASALNRQSAYGADVMSRVEYCMKNGTERLSEVIQTVIGELSATLSDGFDVKRTVIAANTVMSHIYLGADVSGFAQTPFTPVFSDMQQTGNTYILPCPSAYIGGDIAASAIACGLDKETRTVLMLDIGTNAEAVLVHGGEYYCCSAAAGPAFEGAGISCGTGSVDGAVCGFELINGIPSVQTINKKEPVGICGSGICDVIYALLKNGVIDEYGTFNTAIRGNAARYIRNGGFLVGHGVTLTQQDIRAFQTAKAAVRAGVMILLDKAGIKASDIDEVYLCGGFGSGIRAESACGAGILPPEFNGKTRSCGNTAQSGAVSVLCDMSLAEECRAMADKMKIIELGGLPEFERLFIESMNL